LEDGEGVEEALALMIADFAMFECWDWDWDCDWDCDCDCDCFLEGHMPVLPCRCSPCAVCRCCWVRAVEIDKFEEAKQRMFVTVSENLWCSRAEREPNESKRSLDCHVSSSRALSLFMNDLKVH
jgi:hypothetical protein